jgi:hypothetical protein
MKTWEQIEPRDLELMKVSDGDREYATDLLDDLADPDERLSKHELVSEWLRKVRYEATVRARKAAIEECAKFIESGAGMADLIDQDELDEQAKMLRKLATRRGI